MTFVSALLALASSGGGAVARPHDGTPDDILRRRADLARRMDALAASLAQDPSQSTTPNDVQSAPANRLTQWYNWGNWRNGWGNWRNW
ncbi:hypothetical protein [Xanthobacter sp. KR7-65]|uniref:hypothetical protein n=1 Tax=Xanthobacter sp. KR7-65 TaxID=3156612 RepID=UPI0032B4CD19